MEGNHFAQTLRSGENHDDAIEPERDSAVRGRAVFKRFEEEAESRARAIVMAATHFDDPKVLAEVSEQMTGAMHGLAIAGLQEAELLQTRGW